MKSSFEFLFEPQLRHKTLIVDTKFPTNGLFSAADKVGINAFLLYQVIVLAMLHNMTAANHKDLVGVSHRFKAVGNHNNGLIFGQFFDCCLQAILVFGINICGSFIKNDNNYPKSFHLF